MPVVVCRKVVPDSTHSGVPATPSPFEASIPVAPPAAPVYVVGEVCTQSELSAPATPPTNCIPAPPRNPNPSTATVAPPRLSCPATSRARTPPVDPFHAFAVTAPNVADVYCGTSTT